MMFHGADSLPGFTISPVRDNHDGSYLAMETSTAKGRVSLKASVDGKNIGKTLVISVEAVTQIYSSTIPCTRLRLPIDSASLRLYKGFPTRYNKFGQVQTMILLRL
ncbi:MAG: hypothetical protein ACSLEN_12640 [Candidatus Malihini olakiniferum]